VCERRSRSTSQHDPFGSGISGKAAATLVAGGASGRWYPGLTRLPLEPLRSPRLPATRRPARGPGLYGNEKGRPVGAPSLESNGVPRSTHPANEARPTSRRLDVNNHGGGGQPDPQRPHWHRSPARSGCPGSRERMRLYVKKQVAVCEYAHTGADVASTRPLPSARSERPVPGTVRSKQRHAAPPNSTRASGSLSGEAVPRYQRSTRGSYSGWKRASVFPSGSLNQADLPMPEVVAT
jgi:hypothetical protein